MGNDSHIDYRCWFVLKDLLRTLYAPHLLYSSETDYKEPKVVDKLESEVVDEPDLERPVLVDPDIIDEPDSKVVDEVELELEVKELLIETLIDFPVEPTMEPSLTTISLRLPDVYDPL